MFFTQIVLLLSNSFSGRSKKFEIYVIKEQWQNQRMCKCRAVIVSTCIYAHCWVHNYTHCQNHGFLLWNILSEQRKWVYFRQLHFKKMKNLAFSCDNNSVALWHRIFSYGKSVALMTALNLSWKNEKANLFSCTHGCTLSRFIYLPCGKAKKRKKTASK